MSTIARRWDRGWWHTSGDPCGPLLAVAPHIMTTGPQAEVSHATRTSTQHPILPDGSMLLRGAVLTGTVVSPLAWSHTRQGQGASPGPCHPAARHWMQRQSTAATTIAFVARRLGSAPPLLASRNNRSAVAASPRRGCAVLVGGGWSSSCWRTPLLVVVDGTTCGSHVSPVGSVAHGTRGSRVCMPERAHGASPRPTTRRFDCRRLLVAA